MMTVKVSMKGYVIEIPFLHDEHFPFKKKNEMIGMF